jgi:DNA-binding response OmpR family regulator
MHVVLIVEDDPGIQEVLRFFAEANDMRVVAAGTCDAAIREAKSLRPDLAIVDLLVAPADHRVVGPHGRLAEASGVDSWRGRLSH